MAGNRLIQLKTKAILSSRQYQSRYRLEDKRLLDSVREFGFLQPVLTTSQTPVQIIAGHRRVNTASLLSIEEMPVIQLVRELTPKKTWILALGLNDPSSWSDLDRALIIAKSLKFDFKQNEIVEKILPFIGLPAEVHRFDEAVTVANLSDSIHAMIADQKLPFRGAKKLGRFSKEDQDYFAREIAAQLAFTSNQMMEACEWLYDLMRQSHQSLAGVLRNFQPEALSRHENPDKRLKTDKWLQGLRAIRFPQLAEREKRVQHLMQGIQAGPDWNVEPPAGLEAEGIMLRARLRRVDSLDRVLDDIKKNRSILQSLFDII